MNEKAEYIEQALENWAWCARGFVNIGFPGATTEHTATFGKGRIEEPEWPKDAIEVEKALLALDEEPREAIKLYYVRHRHISNIAKNLHCHPRKVADLLSQGRRHIGGWLMARKSA